MYAKFAGIARREMKQAGCWLMCAAAASWTLIPTGFWFQRRRCSFRVSRYGCDGGLAQRTPTVADLRRVGRVGHGVKGGIAFD
jgi:hypothetical protein